MKKPLPNFFDGFYDRNWDIERSSSMEKILLKFESIVENVKKATNLLRASNFDAHECTAILDAYYYGEISEVEVITSQNDNYYYVLSMPELLDIEFALETLRMENGEVREKVDKLKRELWQLLPDFYRGHSNPMPQPLSYDPEKPYPYSCIESSLTKIRPHKLIEWRLALEHMDEYARYMPSDDTQLAILSFKEGDVTIGTESIPTDIHWTEMYPFDNMLSFAEDIICNHDPTRLVVDPEGPPIFFYTTGAPSADNVKVVIHWEFKTEDTERVVTLSAILNRRQVAQCLIAECEKAIKNHTKGSQENAKRGYYTDLDYVYEWEQKVKRLKSIA